MENFILNLIESNLNFQLGYFILFYLILLWVLVAVWVFIDALRRYNSVFLGLLFSFIVLMLNIPGLLFYIILRPEKSEDNILIIQDNHDFISKRGGINLPIINFTDKDGNASISINLSLSRSLLQKEVNNYDQHNENSDIRINIDLDDIGKKKFKVSEDQDDSNKIQMNNRLGSNIDKSKRLNNKNNLVKIFLGYLSKIRDFFSVAVYNKIISYIDSFKKQDHWGGVSILDKEVISNQKTNIQNDADKENVDVVSAKNKINGKKSE